MDRVTYHVYHRPNHQWETRRAGRFAPDCLVPTQAEAIRRAVYLIGDRNAQLVIHGADGKVQEERSYVRRSEQHVPG